jgi:FlaA1/EpsC-like NDP-sugar epimerase
MERLNTGPLEQQRVLITGGTGSLGQILARRILGGEMGHPAKVMIFSRDEAKQHFMRLEYHHKREATDEVIYRNFQELLEFRIGDVRDRWSLASVLRDADVVVNAAALKQVPTCEYFPAEAVKTNILGPENIVSVIETEKLPVKTVVGVSTDKACKPVNTMGMTKAIQERIFIQGNMRCGETRFVCVRYGNVLASRGSVIPLFHEQIRRGGPVTITTTMMTRFLLSLDDAVDTVFAAIREANRGDTYIPRAPSARMTDLARVLINGRSIETVITGIRPGEKTNEILISEEEAIRVAERGQWYAIRSLLPEIGGEPLIASPLTKEYSSSDNLMSEAELRQLLVERRLMVEDAMHGTEMLG